MEREAGAHGFLGTVYYMLRGIMITIGITPPPPGNEWWVAAIFFGVCALVAIGTVWLGVLLLRNMMIAVL